MSRLFPVASLAGLLFFPHVASAGQATFFPPQWTFNDGTSIAVAANLAWDYNHRDSNTGPDRDAHGWRRQEVGLVVRKQDVFDLHIHNDLHNRMWLGVVLGIHTPSLIAPGKSGKLEIGNAKLAAGLEGVAPTRHMPLMESSAATHVFHPMTRGGINWTQTSKHWLLDVGVFGRDLEDVYVGDTQLLRAAWTPSDNQGHQAHLGLSLSRDIPRKAVVAGQEAPSATVRWTNRGVASLLPDRLANSGTLAGVDTIHRQNLQAMWIDGPLWLQSEYFFQQTRRDQALPDYHSHGGYLSAGWVINAPPRRIVRGMLMQPAVGKDQTGTELVARIGRVDLDDGAIKGGRLDEWTVGANAYLGPHIKLQANLGQSSLARNGLHQRFGVVQMRTQFFF